MKLLVCLLAPRRWAQARRRISQAHGFYIWCHLAKKPLQPEWNSLSTAPRSLARSTS